MSTCQPLGNSAGNSASWLMPRSLAACFLRMCVSDQTKPEIGQAARGNLPEGSGPWWHEYQTEETGDLSGPCHGIHGESCSHQYRVHGLKHSLAAHTRVLSKQKIVSCLTPMSVCSSLCVRGGRFSMRPRSEPGKHVPTSNQR